MLLCPPLDFPTVILRQRLCGTVGKTMPMFVEQVPTSATAPIITTALVVEEQLGRNVAFKGR